MCFNMRALIVKVDYFRSMNTAIGMSRKLISENMVLHSAFMCIDDTMAIFVEKVETS